MEREREREREKERVVSEVESVSKVINVFSSQGRHGMYTLLSRRFFGSIKTCVSRLEMVSTSTVITIE